MLPALPVITKKWKQFVCPSTGQTNEMWCFHTMEYYMAVKICKVLIYGIAQIKLYYTK